MLTVAIVCKISCLNSNRLVGKWQSSLGDTDLLHTVDHNSGRQQNTRCIPHEMPVPHPRYIMASVRAE